MQDDRTWICDTLAHREQAAVPFNVMFSPPARARLEAYYGRGDVEEALGLPLRMSGTKSVKPLYAPAAKHGPRITDEFGVTWSTSDIDRGSPIGPCLPDADLKGYRFPDPAAAYRFEDLADWTTANRSHYTFVWIGDSHVEPRETMVGSGTARSGGRDDGAGLAAGRRRPRVAAAGGRV
jgi:hypothetical protein